MVPVWPRDSEHMEYYTEPDTQSITNVSYYTKMREDKRDPQYI